ncbi:MAG: helicase C-terminal domain-containing protein [Gammaproteobacteria bacterium WSBS_2016_MAG_OTU1]
MPNNVLLEKFRQTPMAILVGSLSFWQGVDVRGGALSLVVADKIPFIPPNNPLLVARDTWCKKCGENAFMQNQFPPAAILMKQVAGRLMILMTGACLSLVTHACPLVTMAKKFLTHCRP